jgi:hypothetical protein
VRRREGRTPGLAGRLVALAALLVAAPAVHALDDEPTLSPRSLSLEHPLHVDSVVDGGRLHAEVWSVLPAPFERIAAELRRPETWCDVVTLHVNVKACVHRERAGEQLVTLYIGYRVFQTPEEAHPLEARLELEPDGDRLRARLTAPKGPFGTSQHRLELIASPADAEHTRLEFRFGQRFGWWAKHAMQVFLATWSRHRVGFTETAPGRWVRGFEGLMERNVVRYHLALQAYLEHPRSSEKDVREARWSRFFELTERHARQLHVMERAEYLDTMRREYVERMKLQQQVGGARLARAR